MNLTTEQPSIHLRAFSWTRPRGSAGTSGGQGRVGLLSIHCFLKLMIKMCSHVPVVNYITQVSHHFQWFAFHRKVDSGYTSLMSCNGVQKHRNRWPSSARTSSAMTSRSTIPASSRNSESHPGCAAGGACREALEPTIVCSGVFAEALLETWWSLRWRRWTSPPDHHTFYLKKCDPTQTTSLAITDSVLQSTQI